MIILTYLEEDIGIEARLVQTETGYFVGTYDLDAQQYYAPSFKFPAWEQATVFFNEYIKPKPISITI